MGRPTEGTVKSIFGLRHDMTWLIKTTGLEIGDDIHTVMRETASTINISASTSAGSPPPICTYVPPEVSCRELLADDARLPDGLAHNPRPFQHLGEQLQTTVSDVVHRQTPLQVQGDVPYYMQALRLTGTYVRGRRVVGDDSFVACLLLSFWTIDYPYIIYQFEMDEHHSFPALFTRFTSTHLIECFF